MTEYRERKDKWHICRDCEREFREEDGNVSFWYDGKPICKRCEDMRGNW